ncbi:hypothetical protein B296_00040056, partial [Ensete ventricosum]
VVFPTLRIENFEEEASEKGLWAHLNLLEERRVKAHLRTLAYKKAMAKLYNARGKLARNSEGPYRVISAVRDGTY